MTIDDFLQEHKQVFKVIARNGISADLIRCVGMVEVFEKAKAEHGHRYAVELCKEKFCLKSKSVVYRILGDLRRAI